MSCPNNFSWRESWGEGPGPGHCLLRVEGVSEAGPGTGSVGAQESQVGDTHCLCRGREPLREERILEHKSNEV